eukprot:gene8983-9943_t
MAVDFYRAARDGHSDSLRLITKRDSNKPGNDGMTPVHWATTYGNLEGLRILMSKGGDPNKPNNEGMTSLHLAASTGQLECLVFLTNFGANIYAIDDNGNSPLQEASNRGRIECMRHLENLITHQMTVDRGRVEKLQLKAKREAERRVREKARVRQRLDKEWEKKVEKQRRSATAAEVKLKKKGKIAQHDFKQYNKETDSLSASESDSLDRKKMFSELIGIRSDSESTDYSSPRSKVTSPDDLDVSMLSFNTDPGNYVMKINGNGRVNGNASANGHNFTSRHSGDIIFGGREATTTELSSTFPFMKPNENGRSNLVVTNGSAGNGRPATSNGNGELRSNKRLGVSLNLPNRSSTSRRRHDLVNTNLSPLATFLHSLQLEEFRDVFVREKIDLRAVSLCSENDLKEIGLPLGPRKKILDAIDKRKTSMLQPGNLEASLV